MPPAEKIASLRIERRPLTDGKPHPRNPRVHPPEGSAEWQTMRESLAHDYFDPLILNERNGMWVAGHFRQKVMLADGYTHADMVIVTYDEETHVARMIAANYHSGDWEKAMLSILAGELDASGLSASLAGLTAKDLASLADEPTISDDTATAAQLITEADKISAEWQVQSGDLFSVGRHHLLCGDCRNTKNWDRLLAGQRLDMIWTDPPYNVAYEGVAGGMMNDHMSAEAYAAFLRAVFTQAVVVTKPGGAIYVAHADSEGGIVRAAFVEAGWYEAACLIWIKNAFSLGRSDYHWQHEPILYGWKPGAAHHWQGGFSRSTIIDGEPDLAKLEKRELIALVNDFRNARDTTIIREARTAGNDLHPTIKPLPLVARHLHNSSRTGELIGEFFGGSGTTLIAAEQTHRRCVATELDPKFCAVILERATRAGLTVEKINGIATD